MKQYLRKHYKLLFPIIHFLLSFLYERRVFIFDLDKDLIQTLPLNQIISDNAERIMGYVISKVMAGAMIFLLWHIIFYVIEHWKDKKNLRVFTVLFALGAATIIISWPEPFCGNSIDNKITYSYALRFWPEYWHNVYTSGYFGGAMMVVPSAVAITIYQWFGFVSVIGYVYNRMLESKVLKGKGSRLLLGILIMPGIYTLCVDSYRTEVYAILCMYIVGKTVLDVIDKRSRSGLELVVDIVLCGFIAVWRTEGIILGSLLFVLQLIYLYSYRFWKNVMWMLCLVFVFALFSLPQKLGDMKYYGKDYSFINSLTVVQHLLSREDSNLSYQGIEEDLQAFEAVAPVELLRFYGLEGYRRYNYAQGRGDINQSAVDAEVASRYVSAYYRMVLHNIPNYLRTQINMLKSVLFYQPFGCPDSLKYVVENDLPEWHLEAWDLGQQDVEQAKFLLPRIKEGIRSRLTSGISSVWGVYTNCLKAGFVYSTLLVLIPVFNVFLFFNEVIRSRKKRENVLGLAGISFILLGQAAAIFLVMPAGALAYFHAFYYCSFLLDIIYMGYLFRRRAERRKETTSEKEAGGLDNGTL